MSVRPGIREAHFSCRERLGRLVREPVASALIVFVMAGLVAIGVACLAAKQGQAAGPAPRAALLAGMLAGAVSAIFVLLVRRQAKHEAPTLNESRMMGVIRSSMEAIVIIDEAQNVVIFNPAAEQIFGMLARDAIGKPLERLIPERFRAAHARHVEQFGQTGVTERQMGFQRVLYGLRADGTEFPVEASISQTLNDNCKLYTVVVRDITGRLAAENSLRQSREELRELSANLQNVREDEKTRIARELHDDLGQQLTAMKMDLSAIERALAAGSADVGTQIAGMRRMIDATVASVRRIAADLRPVMLDDLGLVPAIGWLANDFTNRYGIEVERHLDTGAIHFSNAAASTLFRIIQEALTNVARHAQATRVILSLLLIDGRCELRITDNGQGAQPGYDVRSAGKGKSFGLIGMRERAYMLGASITMETPQGGGFTIVLTCAVDSVQDPESPK